MQCKQPNEITRSNSSLYPKSHASFSTKDKFGYSEGGYVFEANASIALEISHPTTLIQGYLLAILAVTCPSPHPTSRREVPSLKKPSSSRESKSSSLSRVPI